MTLLSLPMSAFLAGVAFHLLFFRRYEHHMHAIRYMVIGSSLWLGAVGIAAGLHPEDTFLHAFIVATTGSSALLCGVYSSVLVTRLFFHPLGRFPGPVLAKISSLWWTSQVWQGDAHLRIIDLHRQYGPIVRIGSNDLSIAIPVGVPVVYGPNSVCRKATWYDEDSPRRSIHTSRDFNFHQQRRRVWSAGFSDKALRGYEKRISQYNDALVARITECEGQVINASQYMNWWAFDIMGNLAFNRDFGMLEKAEAHTAIDMLHEAMAVQAWKLPTWAFRIMVAIPGLSSNYWKFIDYCDEQLKKRLAHEPSTPDIMSTLIKTLETDGSEDSMRTLQADSRTIIVAGSDTTAATLTHVLYELAKNPKEAEKLRLAIKTASADASSNLENVNLVKIDHLNGVINETLRLHPVPPSAITRKVPGQGIHIGDHFIPGSTTVSCPQIAMGLLQECYTDPEMFVPERWYSKPELIADRTGYAPFSLGKLKIAQEGVA
jgi:tryprostatin B 6-hydroxylase